MGGPTKPARSILRKQHGIRNAILRGLPFELSHPALKKHSPLFQVMKLLPKTALFLSLVTFASLSFGQTGKQELLDQIDSTQAAYEEIASKIWNWAELGFKEEQSAALLQAKLKAEGFSVEAGVAGMPTAFIASYGSGAPVIAILAEYDALPGVSQEATPVRKERPNCSAGHACGHNLFGAASVEAAVSVKNWLKATGHAGTIRLYGCPAEEGGSGKVYLVREGRFADVDAALHWHPADRNAVRLTKSLANISAKFRFHGQASHASSSPERGRSALDGVEAMDAMVNMMREHVPSSTRIHYIITRGGDAPNVVPAFAEVYYYVRNPSREVVYGVWNRVTKAAQGAALGTETAVDWEIIGGVHETLPNEALAKAIHANLALVGGVHYTAEETAFSERLRESLPGKLPPLSLASEVQAWDPKPLADGGGSTDVGDVSWAVPTMGFTAATWVPGTPAHSWQAVAAGGTSIGTKGMQIAAKTLALSAVDLFTHAELLTEVKREFLAKRGSDFTYKALLGTRKPALNYRD
jgi:aminobenzoyl-glutamate utilization protein B